MRSSRLLALSHEVFAIFAVGLLLLTDPALGASKGDAPIPRIGVITPGDVEYYDRAFIDGLAANGYKQGETATIEIRGTHGSLEAGAKAAEELVSLDLDVIYAAPGVLAKHVAAAERRIGKRTPIVVLTWDPVAEGLVGSAAHPGGHITGVGGVYSPGELMTKQFQLLRDLVPGARRIACLLDGSWHKEFATQTKSALAKAGRATGIHIEFIDLRDPSGISNALNSVRRIRSDAMLVPSAVLFTTVRPRLLEFAAKHGLPTIYGDELFPYEGGLMSYGASVADMHRRGAGVVAKVLRGADPGTIPIDYNTRFRLVVNARAAKALGITIPAMLLDQADEVLK